MSEAKTLILSAFSNFNPDQILASVVLAELCKDETGSAHVFINTSEFLEKLSFELGESRIAFVTELATLDNHLHLTNLPTPVEDLRWEWHNGTLELEIKSKDGVVVNPQDVKLSTGSAGYDRVIFLGLDSAGEVREALHPYSGDMLNGAETTALMFKDSESKIAHQQQVCGEGKLYAELVWKFAKQKELTLTAEQASKLIAGIYVCTHNLTSANTNAEIVTLVAELMKLGGKLDLLQKVPRETETTKSSREKAFEEVNQSGGPSNPVTHPANVQASEVLLETEQKTGPETEPVETTK